MLLELNSPPTDIDFYLNPHTFLNIYLRNSRKYIIKQFVVIFR